MKKILPVILLYALILNLASCSNSNRNSNFSEQTELIESVSVNEGSSSISITEDAVDKQEIREYSKMSAKDITACLTIEQKAAQMVMPAVYHVSEKEIRENCYGSILSGIGENATYTTWQQTITYFQNQALKSEAAIPFLYGQDDVHGVNYCSGAVIFPHNIGIGAANDAELTYQMGLAVADEAKLCYMLWNFSPCVAQGADPRWGRTYESYSSDIDIIKELSAYYVKGLNDGGLVSCAKHFFADGNVLYGTGENSDVNRIMDRGDAQLSDDEINILLDVYQNLIDTGVQTIMVSHSSLNGVKMHENEKYLQYLKNEMGFKGFIVGDWNSVDNITGENLKEKVIKSVNAGVDMLMQVDQYNECMQYIIEGVNEGKIFQERIDDAVTRIMQVKLDEGIFDDPLFKNLNTKQSAVGSDEYRNLAEKLVEESLVLIKNENNTLPLKQNAKVYLIGPAANNVMAQCGGWTGQWRGSNNIKNVTTISDGFFKVAQEFNIEIITEKDRANEADIVLIVVGENSYAEWEGDTSDLSLTGEFGLDGNMDAINEAQSLGIPTVACVVAGRNIIIDEYKDMWDSVVMCYLPGSEGQGVANVLMGKSDFTGKLPMPWYSSIDQIGTDSSWLEIGYGLSY